MIVSFLKGAFVGRNIPHHIFEFAPIEFGGGHPIGYLRGLLKIVWPEPNMWLDVRDVIVRVGEDERESEREKEKESGREIEKERERERERERFLPEFSIEERVRGHRIDDVLREGQPYASSRKEGLFKGIPKSSNSIVFLE